MAPPLQLQPARRLARWFALGCGGRAMARRRTGDPGGRRDPGDPCRRRPVLRACRTPVRRHHLRATMDAIKVEALTKRYFLGETHAGTLREALSARAKRA